MRKEKAAPPPPTPRPNPKSIAKAQNPVGLRYWNQCLSQAQQSELEPRDSPSVIAGAENEGNVPWAQPETHWAAPSRAGGKTGKFKINVPNINNQIKGYDRNGRTDWASILAEDEAHRNKMKSVRVSVKKLGRPQDEFSPPPKYAWMKSHADRNQPNLSEMSEERQKARSECLEGRNVGGNPWDRQNKQVSQVG